MAGKGAEAVEHAEHRLEQPVDGEERVRQGHPPHGRVADVALVPLLARQAGDHGEVAPEHVARPLTRSLDRVFILWGMAEDPTWPSAKPSVASSAPAMSRIVMARLDGPAAGLDEGGHDVEVEGPGVHLADAA